MDPDTGISDGSEPQHLGNWIDYPVSSCYNGIAGSQVGTYLHSYVWCLKVELQPAQWVRFWAPFSQNTLFFNLKHMDTYKSEDWPWEVWERKLSRTGICVPERCLGMWSFERVCINTGDSTRLQILKCLLNMDWDFRHPSMWVCMLLPCPTRKYINLWRQRFWPHGIVLLGLITMNSYKW